MSKKEKKEKAKVKKIAIIVISIIAILAVVSVGLFFVFRKDGNNSDNKIATQSVKIFTENMNLFQNKYAGMVVAQDTIKIKKDTELKVKELYVEKGQTVEKGQKLFEYDTTENSNKVEQTKLEIEKMENSIANSKKQIQNLLEESKTRPDDPEISIEIQTLENDIKQTEYNIKTKNLEISNLNKTIKNSVITAEINGVIQNINDGDNDTSMGYQDGEDDSYITIMQTGDYKIKGVVNEQNVMMFSEGQKVIIRSRLDENKTWNGTITKVDTSNPESNDNNSGMMMYGNSDTMTTSSKYPFYINLEQKDGLMMGQHVYIEFDYGQIAKQDGIWIPSYFIVEDAGNNYIWVAGKGDKLEKRKVTIGSKDENLLEVQITEGLSKDDYIADPSQELTEGLKVEKYDSVSDIPMIEDDEDINMNIDMGENGEIIDMTNGNGELTVENGAIIPDTSTSDTVKTPDTSVSNVTSTSDLTSVTTNVQSGATIPLGGQQ